MAWALSVAFALRLVWALCVPIVPVSDSIAYDEFARSIVAGRGFAFADGSLTAFWPVGTSALYAAVYRIFGTQFGWLAALNVLLGTGLVALTYAVARRHVNEAVALTSAWIVACWPLLVEFTTILASELPFTFLLLAALYVWGGSRLGTVWRSVAWGTLLCAAVYVRPTAAPLFIILPVLEYARDRDARKALLSMVSACIAAAILFSPWVARNYAVFDRFCLVSANFGANLWMGNNPASDGGYMPLTAEAAGPSTNEVDRDAHLKKQAVDFIRANPGAYLKLSFKRLVMTYGRESIGIVWNAPGLESTPLARLGTPLKLVSNLFWAAAFVLCLYGIAVSALRLGRRLWVQPLWIVPALFFIVPVMTVGQDRYHVPLNPFIAVFAAVALLQIRQRFAAGRPSASPLTVEWQNNR